MRARVLPLVRWWVSAVYATVSLTSTHPPTFSSTISKHHLRMMIEPKRHTPNRGNARSALKNMGRHATLGNFRPPDYITTTHVTSWVHTYIIILYERCHPIKFSGARSIKNFRVVALAHVYINRRHHVHRAYSIFFSSYLHGNIFLTISLYISTCTHIHIAYQVPTTYNVREKYTIYMYSH